MSRVTHPGKRFAAFAANSKQLASLCFTHNLQFTHLWVPGVSTVPFWGPPPPLFLSRPGSVLFPRSEENTTREESTDKSWPVTLPLFANQFNKERRTLERANNNKNFDSANVFRERRTTGAYAHNAPPTTNADYNAAMEYAAAMELKSTAQEGRITDARSSRFRQSSR